MMKWDSVAPGLSLIIILMGLSGVVGWLEHIPFLIQFFSTDTNMVMNTSITFVFAGLSLLGFVYSPPLQKKIYMIPAAVVLALAGLTMMEYWFGALSGFDNLFVDSWLNDHSRYPGRMSQNTAFAFLCASAALLLMPYAKQRMVAVIVQVSIYCVLILGLIAMVGYALNLEFLYNWYQHMRMSAHSAIGFTLLGIGLVSAWNKSEECAYFYKDSEDKRILVVIVVILTAITLISGLAGFSTSTKQNEEILKNYLKATLSHRIGLFNAALTRPTNEMADLSKNAIILAALKNGKMDKSKQEELTKQLFLQSYSAIVVTDAHGDTIYSQGEFIGKPEHTIDLASGYHGELLWKDRFTYKISNKIFIAGKEVGEIIAEWPLDSINQLLINEGLYICSAGSIGGMLCLPKMQNDGATDNVFMRKDAQQAFMQTAKTGNPQILKGIDDTGKFVMAAILAVPALNVSFIYKENADSLYQPIRNQLEVASPLLLTAIGFGVLLLYWQVLPLLRKVISSEKKALESSIHLSAIVNHAAEGIVTVNEHNEIETLNANAAKTFGYSLKELSGKDINSLMAKTNALGGKKNVMELLRDEKLDQMFKCNVEVQGIKKNGVTFPLELSSTAMTIDNHKKLVIILRDISERKSAEEKLQESEARFRLAFDSAASGVALMTLDGYWLKVNAALCRITGYSQTEMLKMRYQDILCSDDLPQSDEKLKQLIDGVVNSIENEERYTRKDGKVIWLLNSVALVRDKKGLPLYLVTQTQEVTEQKKEAAELSYQAYYDALTGLVNRNQLEQRLELTIADAMRNKKNFSVFFIDLDFFKQVNDTLGHDAGDDLLKVVADRIKNSIRQTDVAARIGGDEFILVMNEVSTPESAAFFAEKVMHAIRQPIKIRGHEVNVGTSVGISFFPNDGIDYESLIKSADLALYRSKELGRNNYQFCTPEMNNEITERIKFKVALEEALAKNKFYLDYLPKIDVETGRISAVETLLRWRDELYGDVSPAKIIPVAEESGLFLPLGEWIINTTCKQVKDWQEKQHIKLNVAVNVSKRQFKHPLFPSVVLSAIKKTGLAPSHLEFEIAEDLLMQDPEHSLKVVHALKDIGVQITMDNFGTGYSSLVYLHQFAVDRIKIDRGLVQKMSVNSWHASLVAAIVALAKNLGIRVAAEGVETAEQYELLKSFGCDEIQGYLISQPLGTDKMVAFLGKKVLVV